MPTSDQKSGSLRRTRARCASEASSPRATSTGRAGAAGPAAPDTSAHSGAAGGRPSSRQRCCAGGTVVETEEDTTLLESTWPGTDSVRDWSVTSVQIEPCSGRCGVALESGTTPTCSRPRGEPESFILSGRKQRKETLAKRPGIPLLYNQLLTSVSNGLRGGAVAGLREIPRVAQSGHQLPRVDFQITIKQTTSGVLTP